MILSPQECQCPLSDDGGVSLVDSPICPGTFTFMVLLQAFLKGRCNIATPCQRIESVDELRSEYDFIVVGGGSAGSLVAGRLSENENYNVLLLEAGPAEPIGARPPSFYRTFWSNQIDWQYRTVPADYCLDQNGQGCMWPRGKVLGGSSVLNGMMYHRGHPADYEDWVNAGATGWSWEENLPYFEKTEGNKQIGTLVSEKYHSASGPMPVQQFNYQPRAAHVLLQAIDQTGMPVIADMNDPETPEGFTIAQMFTENGQRYTTARVFVQPKPNLDVKLESLVSKVLFEGNRAVGVEFIDENGEKRTARASKEVILSAGALNTPQILMLSGVGPKEVLEPLDIPVVADLPVGKSLKNHYGMTFYFNLTKLEDTDVLDWSVLTEYLLKRDGPMSGTGITQLTGLMYSSLADKSRMQPDLQFFFNGFYAECSQTGAINELRKTGGRNVSANAALLLPRSSGYLTINSTDPTDPPIFYPGYFENPEDMMMIRDGARYLQRIFSSEVMQQYGIELDNSTTERCAHLTEWSDEWIDCLARVNTDPQNHQISTAAMGLVVDPQLRVYQIDGLRVIDASAIPTLPTGNPQGPIMMVAERGVSFIRETWG